MTGRSLRWSRVICGVLVILLASCSDAGVGGGGRGSSSSDRGEVWVPPASATEQPPSDEASPTITAAPTATPDPAYVLGGLDTALPCIARSMGGPLVRIGVGPQDIAAMSPAQEVRRALSKLPAVEGYEWESSSGFRDNADLASESLWPEACAVFVSVGRVTGFAAEASLTCSRDECPGDPEWLPETVVATVHVMQTEAGAQAFLEWLATTPWGVVGAQPAVYLNDSDLGGRPGKAERIQRDGLDLTRVTDRADQGEVELVLFRQGATVGEILLMGPPGAKTGVDTLALAVAVAKRVASVSRGPDPYDIVEVMSAPLTIPAPGCIDGCQVQPEPGFSDNEEFLYHMGLQTPEGDAHVARYGRRVGFTVAFGVDGGSVETGFTLYPTPASARAAAADLNTDRMLGGYPTYFGDDNLPSIIGRFEVPGVAGAVGLAIQVDHQGVALTPSWIVRFPHEYGVAEVRVDGWDSLPDDQIASMDGQQLAMSLADELATRLAAILG